MKKLNHRMLPRFDRELCVACGMCVDICPNGALELQIFNSVRGFRRYPSLSPGKTCIGCRSCEKECFNGAILMIPRQDFAKKEEAIC